MRKILAAILLLAATEGLALQSGRTVRVVFKHGCQPSEKWIDVRLGGENGSEPRLDKVADGIYETDLQKPIGTTLRLEVATDLPICCIDKGVAVPDPKHSADWDIEYAVYCDTPNPSWAARGKPFAKVSFELRGEHVTKFEKRCRPVPRASLKNQWLTDLHGRDTVLVEVINGTQYVVSFELKLTDFTGSEATKSKRELLDIIEARKSEAGSLDRTGGSRQQLHLIEMRKAAVPPEGVTVEKR